MGTAFAILAFGNDEQRKKYLPALAKGEKLGTVATAEPSGGANWLMTLRTQRDAKTLSLHPTPDSLMLIAGKMLLGIPLGPPPGAGGPPG